jgi:hypothetical protein
MRRLPAALSALVGLMAASGGCRRATLGGPDAGGPGGLGGLDAGIGGGSDAVAVGDAPAVDVGATDALVWLPFDPLYHCPSVPSVPVCPSDRPATGGACALAGAICEYGGHDIGCRGRWSCSDGLTWQPILLECAGVAAGQCPDQTPPNGSACDVDVNCSYPAQGICACDRSSMSWTCVASLVGGEPGCPDQLPFYGAACDRQGPKICHYGGCGFYFASCCSGTWIPQPGGACSE